MVGRRSSSAERAYAREEDFLAGAGSAGDRRAAARSRCAAPPTRRASLSSARAAVDANAGALAVLRRLRATALAAALGRGARCGAARRSCGARPSTRPCRAPARRGRARPSRRAVSPLPMRLADLLHGDFSAGADLRRSGRGASGPDGCASPRSGCSPSGTLEIFRGEGGAIYRRCPGESSWRCTRQARAAASWRAVRRAPLLGAP